ncbi:Sodium, potassium, lithium and rubidium/H(+) antiporter [Micromonospora sp. MW-13]|uniref:Na+/H+ antiporter n=1 Tax=unclassified Micromonospora TaxID=2617518 RepID=UPI000E4403E7|nr:MULTISPECIES: Na+/H+ antiporter [unclassified Micromonospora]MCX4473326.1 Na+/H+ antiporter [Micromonospora sp. NBC_01655]RGC67368.1 Sodium, potassium, lithium and rubidium/H(+) antiporter [Micromonospora sp. MW-13]
MESLFEVVVFLAIATLGAALARRLGLLAPILLVVVGLALSFVPGFPQVRLDPDLVLVGILPPLLYVAALETSVPAFRLNLRPILLLAVGLVIFTAFAVGLVVHLLLPAVPFAVCLALGAVVAPPDAVAATAVARRIGLPRRVVTILEGESLINDATALVLLRVATMATIGTSVGVGDVAREVLVATGGGILVGLAGVLVFGFLHKRISDAVLDNALSLIVPFAVVFAAEAVHASGVVAVVVTGLGIGHRMPMLMSAASRLQIGAFWRLARFLLEGLVFLLVGLQLREVVRDLNEPLGFLAAITVAVLATVVVTRFVWIFPATYLARLVPRIRQRETRPSARFPIVIGWAGMRGVVTLAAALALPLTLAQDRPYPRQLFIWLAFAVIVVTLVAQGATLPAVARRLRLPPDDPVQDALSAASVQQQASRAARDRLDALADTAPTAVVDRLRRGLTERTNLAWERLGGTERETPSQAYGRLRQEMIDAEREVFRAARDAGRIPEEVLVRAYRDLDLEESLLRQETD